MAAVQVVALVGPSGGGKSSVVKLIERFYLPEAGQVGLSRPACPQSVTSAVCHSVMKPQGQRSPLCS